MLDQLTKYVDETLKSISRGLDSTENYYEPRTTYINVNQEKVTSKCDSHWLVEFAERRTKYKAKQVAHIYIQKIYWINI